mmetsp:Transcript_7002/g.19868  ORF Transcript_7002/g.19868 Transcript_7002/m.19868 type:complete len:787 (+) Transcript_7002:59-2419(+)
MRLQRLFDFDGLPSWAALLCSWVLVIEASEHDTFQAMTTVHQAAQQYLPERAAGGKGRRLEAESQTCEQIHSGDALEGPIRIGFETLDAGEIPEDVQAYVASVMSNATAYFATILHVRQVQAPLFIDYPADGYYPNDPVPYIKDDASPPTCGPDRVLVPDKYLRPTQGCSTYCHPTETCACGDSEGGCKCDADMWNLQKEEYCCKINNQCSNCQAGTFDPAVVEARARNGDLGAYAVCKSGCRDLPSGDGADGKDTFVFVTVKDTLNCQESEALLAYATHCATDQCDRPIFGHINFCLKKISTGDHRLAFDIGTAVHELSHVLGFSAPLLPYFRTPEGTPRVPRSETNPRKFVDEVGYRCQDNVISEWDVDSDGSPHRFVELTAHGMIGYYNERGFSSCGCPTSKTGMTDGKCLWKNADGLHVPNCVTKLTTPKVKDKVQEHFACYDLEGAELENQDTSTCSIYASHWESRLFNGEIMAAASSDYSFGFVSEVTLALYQDSGWYNVVWENADNLIRGVHWGYQKGCGFARKDKCIVDGDATESTFFCADAEASACSTDRLSAKKCSLGEIKYNGPIPEVFDYFNGKTQFGSNPLMDYCPTFEILHTNRICVNMDSDTRSNPPSVQREVFGESSRCFISDFHEEIYHEMNIKDNPLCFATKCSEDLKSYQAGIGDGAGGVDWLDSCYRAGQEVRKLGFGGRILCAHPAEICSVRLPKYLQGLPKRFIDAATNVKGDLFSPGRSAYIGGSSANSGIKDASGRMAPASAIFASALLSLTLVSRGDIRPF